MHEITCNYCGKVVKVDSKRNVFCNRECYLESRKNLKNCESCKTPFECKRGGRGRFCSRRCSNYARRKRVKVNCFICKREVEIHPSELNYKKNKYCSRECARRGYSLLYSGENSARYNHKMTEEDRIINRKYEDYRRWRLSIYVADSYTCRKCRDSSGGNLEAHHLFNYAEYPNLRTDKNNGITMCKSCHKTFHDIYGYNNNNPYQLMIYLNQSIPSQDLPKGI